MEESPIGTSTPQSKIKEVWVSHRNINSINQDQKEVESSMRTSTPPLKTSGGLTHADINLKQSTRESPSGTSTPKVAKRRGKGEGGNLAKSHLKEESSKLPSLQVSLQEESPLLQCSQNYVKWPRGGLFISNERGHVSAPDSAPKGWQSIPSKVVDTSL